MTILNKSKKSVLFEDVVHLKSFLELTAGLIMQKNPSVAYFQTHFGIHTFGMLLPIDVYILDNEKRVVKIQKKLTPMRVFFWNPAYSHVIESPHEDKNEIEIGDMLEFK